jgi:hypothetical protein
MQHPKQDTDPEQFKTSDPDPNAKKSLGSATLITGGGGGDVTEVAVVTWQGFESPTRSVNPDPGNHRKGKIKTFSYLNSFRELEASSESERRF